MKIRNAHGNDRPPAAARGAAAVEFAIVIILLVLILGGIVEFGRIFWCYNTLTKATRDGARLMSNADGATLHSAITPNLAAEDEARQVVLAEADGAGLYPVLASYQVRVQCTYLSGTTEGAWGDCHNSSGPLDVPVHVKVGIKAASADDDYRVNLGEWFPLFPGSGVITLAPETVMRYMR